MQSFLSKGMPFLFCMVFVLFLFNPFSAQAAVITSAQAGSWSQTTTWTGGVVPGDGDFPIIKHNVVIDQNIGTVAGGGVKSIHVENNATLSVDSTAARTIIFGSTGIDPLGTGGSAANPRADATMHGFFVTRGTLSLIGTSANPITITTANDSSPFYIHHQRGDYNNWDGAGGGAVIYNGAVLVMRYVDAKHIGTNSAGFYGVDWPLNDYDTNPLESVNIQNSRFTDYYKVHIQGGGLAVAMSMTLASNSFIGGRSAYSFESKRAQAIGWTITDNTETGGTVEGAFASFLYAPNGLVFQRNAVLGSASVMRGCYRVSADASPSAGNTVTYNYCNNLPNTGPVVGMVVRTSPADTSSTYSYNIITGYRAAIAPSDNATISYNWLHKYPESGSGQGPIITYGIGRTYLVNHNITVIDDNSDVSSLFYTSASSTLNTIRLDSNTFINSPLSSGVYLGEYGSTPNYGVNGYVRNNIVTGGIYGIVDGSTTNNWDVAEVAAYGGGAHHNLTYGQSNSPYQLADGGSPNFSNGVTAHPNAIYGDLTVDPQLVDPSRRPAGWDASLGGPGTVANIFAELTKRSGFGGAYDSRYNIADLRTWLFAGSAPQNSLLKTASTDGTAVGAVSFVDINPTTVSITSPSESDTISGSITLTSSATDLSGIAGVKFYYDDVNLIDSEVTVESSPDNYSVTLDTASLSNGSHTLTALARDDFGNTTTSASVTVTVDNTPETPAEPAASTTAENPSVNMGGHRRNISNILTPMITSSNLEQAKITELRVLLLSLQKQLASLLAKLLLSYQNKELL